VNGFAGTCFKLRGGRPIKSLREAVMPAVELFAYPKAVTVTHYPEVKACVAAWVALSSPHFREAVERGMRECGKLGVKSWIVDLSGDSPGVPNQADLKWIETDCVTIARRNGVLCVINVLGQSAVATMGAKRWNKIVGAGGMATYDCASLTDALTLAGEIAAGRAA
jgi:hypothetical protein